MASSSREAAQTPPAPTPSDQQSATGRGSFAISRARGVFWLLFAINALNYLDRLIAVAVSPTLKTQFHLTDADIGLLSSAFLLIYTLTALPAGALADRLRARAKVIAIGVAIWSVFSGLTAAVRGYRGLFVTRALVGVGEASYSPAGVALLVNYFPPHRRAGIIGRWQSAQVLGSLLAFLLAGVLYLVLPPQSAWRIAFVVTALPGLLLAALAWRVADAPEHAFEQAPTEQTPVASPAAQPRNSLRAELGALWRQTLQTLRIPMIWIIVALQAVVYITVTPSVTFLPIYIRAANGPFHLTASHASFLLGGTLIVGGILGTILGGALSDRLNRRIPGGRVLAVTIGFVLAIPCFIAMLLTHSLVFFVVASMATTLTLNLPGAALTATPQDVAPPHLRATAIAVMMLLSHLLGDIWAAWAVGALALRLHDQLHLALLAIGTPALVLGVVVSALGVRVYARRHAEAR